MLLPGGIQRGTLRKLRMLHNARAVNDPRTSPGNRLEKLSRERLGRHSIRINLQWWLCLRWHDGVAYEVEIVDSH